MKHFKLTIISIVLVLLISFLVVEVYLSWDQLAAILNAEIDMRRDAYLQMTWRYTHYRIRFILGLIVEFSGFVAIIYLVWRAFSSGWKRLNFPSYALNKNYYLRLVAGLLAFGFIVVCVEGIEAYYRNPERQKQSTAFFADIFSSPST